MENTQLLCTFSRKKLVDETLSTIKQTYKSVSKVFILENIENDHEVLCTYNVLSSELKEKSFLRNTISVHRNKNTNTLYTINAVNEVVLLLNDGERDNNFKINWEHYKNMLMVTNETGLKKIPTKVFKIVTI